MWDNIQRLTDNFEIAHFVQLRNNVIGYITMWNGKCGGDVPRIPSTEMDKALEGSYLRKDTLDRRSHTMASLGLNNWNLTADEGKPPFETPSKDFTESWVPVLILKKLIPALET